MKSSKQLIQKLFPLSGILLILFLTEACAPVFSDMQSARTLGKGNIEATPYYTNSGTTSEYKGVSLASLNFGVGLSDQIDLRGRLSYLWNNGEEGGVTIFGVGPKFEIVPEKLSFFLPVGGTFTGEIWQLQPTVFYSLPLIENKLETTISPKYVFNVCQGCSGYFATNLGFAFSKDLSKYAIRAEYGRVFVEGGGVGQFSLGYSFTINTKEK